MRVPLKGLQREVKWELAPGYDPVTFHCRSAHILDLLDLIDQKPGPPDEVAKTEHELIRQSAQQAIDLAVTLCFDWEGVEADEIDEGTAFGERRGDLPGVGQTGLAFAQKGPTALGQAVLDLLPKRVQLL